MVDSSSMNVWQLYPQTASFGWFSQKHHTHGIKLCWQDKVRRDLNTFSIPETSWYVWVQVHSIVSKHVCHKGSLQLLVARTKMFLCLSVLYVAISFGELGILQDTSWSVILLSLELAAISLTDCVDKQPAWEYHPVDDGFVRFRLCVVHTCKLFCHLKTVSQNLCC